MSFATAFTPEKLTEAWEIILRDFPLGLWDTLYVTLLSTLFAIVIGLPLGMILVACDEKGIRPWPKPLMKTARTSSTSRASTWSPWRSTAASRLTSAR